MAEEESVDNSGGAGSSGEGSEGAAGAGSERQFGTGSSMDKGGEGGGGAPAHWNTHIKDESIRTSPAIVQMNGVATIEEAINSLASQNHHAQKALGNQRVEMPNDQWTPEQHKKWNQDVRGVPENVDGYKLEGIKAPDGIKLGEDVQKDYVASFHELSMDDAQITGVLNKYYERVGTENAAWQEEQQAQVNTNTLAMKSEWGDKYEFNLDVAERGLKQHGGDNLIAVLQANPAIMSMPEVQRVFFQLGMLEMDDALRTDDYSTLDGANKALKLEEEITNLEGSELWQKILGNKNLPNEKVQVAALKERRTTLHRELAVMKQKAKK